MTPDEQGVGNMLTINEVSQLLSIPLATLRSYRYMGKGPKSFRLGGRVRYLQSDVDRWVLEEYAKENNGQRT